MLIHDKKTLKEFLDYELSKYGNSRFNFLGITENQILKKHQIILRKTEYFVNTNNKIMSLIYRLRLSRIQNKYSLHIPINVCDKGFKIMHLGPILINNNAKIGKDCTMHINTCIVAGGTDNKVPTLNNGIVIGCGAVILGGVTLANNIAVGANAVVNKSFEEEDIAIAGVPAKKISNNGRTKWNKK
ncbi:MAG: serine acetyltransferase [Clostridia bacterium]|nr:serine acetyltransferase [Clostridia bacterium]